MKDEERAVAGAAVGDGTWGVRHCTQPDAVMMRQLQSERTGLMDKVRIGVIGCGAISGAYLGMAKNFPLVEVAACADMNIEAARKKATEFGVAKVCGVDELLADPSIELVLNLTVPKAHVPV